MSEIKIKNKKFFKNKIQMVIYIILFVFLLCMFVVLGKMDYHEEISDAEQFALEFNQVGKDNIFKYVNTQDAYLELTGQNTIILLGHQTEWVNYYAKILNDVAKDLGITKIYYYDFLSDRNEANGTYEAIVNYLNDYVMHDDLGNSKLSAPTLVIVKNKRIIYFDDETSLIKGAKTPNKYWDEYQINRKKQELESALSNYLER